MVETQKSIEPLLYPKLQATCEKNLYTNVSNKT